jgi:murein L,D-transpeptidase YcbB/YkuD
MMRSNVIVKGITVSLFITAFLLANFFAFKGNSSHAKTDSDLSTLIKRRVTGWKIWPKTVFGGEAIYSYVLVKHFYSGRRYQPAWVEDGHLIQADVLIKAIEETYGDGLTPDYYHLKLVRSLAERVNKGLISGQSRLVDLDLLLTDAFITLGCHLSGGCVDPLTIKSQWFAKRSTVDVASVLEQALERKRIREAVMKLRPQQASYDRLRQALAVYRSLLMRGEWPRVSGGRLLRRGSVSERVVELRRRIAASRDIADDATNRTKVFDTDLEEGVLSFQKRHGLKADGEVGPETLNALNVPLKKRIRQIELNMERLRWILGNVEQRSIFVNIANFRLYVVDNGRTVLSMKVVVGKPYWDTPVFTSKMTYLIINPSWNVPDSIARREILKEIRKDPDYLGKENIQVLKGWGSREEEIDPEKIDWSRITPENLPYRFRQEPGPLNPLGRLKFMLPNKFNVYLHDTSARSLFSSNVRAFSHGCTRIEKPLELADYLLRDDPAWTRDKLLAAIDDGTEQKINILHPLNVHFLYLTSWVDEKGTVQFRKDIYGRDKLLDEALHGKPPFGR